jgi:hypothetical protein
VEASLGRERRGRFVGIERAPDGRARSSQAAAGHLARSDWCVVPFRSSQERRHWHPGARFPVGLSPRGHRRIHGPRHHPGRVPVLGPGRVRFPLPVPVLGPVHGLDRDPVRGPGPAPALVRDLVPDWCPPPSCHSWGRLPPGWSGPRDPRWRLSGRRADSVRSSVWTERLERPLSYRAPKRRGAKHSRPSGNRRGRGTTRPVPASCGARCSRSWRPLLPAPAPAARAAKVTCARSVWQACSGYARQPPMRERYFGWIARVVEQSYRTRGFD